MSEQNYPQHFVDRLVTHQQALKETVVSGSKIVSGFATSEPARFYEDLWDHIIAEDVTDLTIKNALFMAPHRLLVGDALASKGLFEGFLGRQGNPGVFGNIARKANSITKKLEGLDKLIEHFKELRERRIVFASAFTGAAENMIIPINAITRLKHSAFMGRNKSRMGIVHMQSVHFPDAVYAMGYDDNRELAVDVFPLVMTPPDEKGFLSHGVANGANSEMLEILLRESNANILLYINRDYPFTWGYGEDAANTIHADKFKDAAAQGRLFVIEDDGNIPGLPAGAFDHPSKKEIAIAGHVVNHIEANLDIMKGRAIQVGIGGTGVLAIKGLMDTKWTGRCYTEMLEPFTMNLLEAGKVNGTHFIERNGTRTMVDGKICCTFTMGEQGSGFYEKLNRNKSVICAPASRVVVSEGFFGGMGINNVLSVDFHGHINSGGRDKNHYSGIGGAATIVRGLARGGVSYLCCKSTHKTPEGKRRSSVFPFLPQGTPISIIGPDLMGTRDGALTYLVTEHGVAKINAMDQHSFIKSIISVAHPDYRDWLKQQAWQEFRVSV
jgi:acyl-CoA hydrolase